MLRPNEFKACGSFGRWGKSHAGRAAYPPSLSSDRACGFAAPARNTPTCQSGEIVDDLLFEFHLKLNWLVHIDQPCLIWSCGHKHHGDIVAIP